MAIAALLLGMHVRLEDRYLISGLVRIFAVML